MGFMDYMSQLPTMENRPTVTPGQQLPQPAVNAGEAEHALFMKYAQKAAMLGLNEDADNFLNIAKSLPQGLKADDIYVGDIQDPNDPKKMIKAGLTKTGGKLVWSMPLGQERFKTANRQQVVLENGDVIDTLWDATNEKMMYWDTNEEKLKVLNKKYVPANQMLSPEEAATLGLPYGTTKGQAASLGVMPISPTQRVKLSAFDVSKNIVNDISKYSEKVNTFKAGNFGLGRLVGGAANAFGAWAQTNPDAKMLDTKSAEMSMIIRALGETGALAEGDVTRGLNAIPTLWDSDEVAKSKLSDLNNLFDANKASIQKALTSPIYQDALKRVKGGGGQIQGSNVERARSSTIDMKSQAPTVKKSRPANVPSGWWYHEGKNGRKGWTNGTDVIPVP